MHHRRTLRDDGVSLRVARCHGGGEHHACQRSRQHLRRRRRIHLSNHLLRGVQQNGRALECRSRLSLGSCVDREHDENASMCQFLPFLITQSIPPPTDSLMKQITELELECAQQIVAQHFVFVDYLH